jgi:spermidine synthase
VTLGSLFTIRVVKSGLATRGWLVCLLYGITGCAGLAYETVWIRQFSISFGNTLLSFSTVISIYLGGLALGAAWAGRMRARRGLALFGAAEVWIGLYSLVIPWLMDLSQPLLAPLYGSGEGGSAPVGIARFLLSASILLPATIPMGASLPWLASWLDAEGAPLPRLSWIYTLNILGGAVGAVLTGLWLLPHAGYSRALLMASGLDIAAGAMALWLARKVKSGPVPARSVQKSLGAPDLSLRMLGAVAALSGWSAMLYEVAWSRIAGLMFGPTAATVTLTLAVFLLGLAAGAVLASSVRRDVAGWLSSSQSAVAVLLLCGSACVAISPSWLAEQIRLQSGSVFQIEALEAGLLFLLLFPLAMTAGMALPLAMRLLRRSTHGPGEAIGGLYAVNTAGCIAGALMAGWLLIPYLGTERTLYAGATVNAALGIVLSPGLARRAAGLGIAALALAGLVLPQWDLAAMTAGAYKYAPYYGHGAASELHQGEIVFLREGAAGTVTIRRSGGSLVMAIDGKVDASDVGGDLLTEKLLAHLPLQRLARTRNVCVIGLASGVTAGAALTYPIERLDVVEVSPEVVQASHLFDGVNGKPLAATRTHLIVNDGRNHLALAARQYDAILSEPSNPWISGMNSMFTRDFFRIARRRLNPGGVLAQWFHLYNMPPGDLRSLLRAFTEVFPSAALWQLNDGDVLLTGFAEDETPERPAVVVNRSAAADLAAGGVDEPSLLSTLYVMRGADLVRFAGGDEPNTDDWPVLEFHGLRNLHSQTDTRNMQELAAFPKQVSPPGDVRAVQAQMTPETWSARGRMFERAESYRLAFDSYRNALALGPAHSAAIAGMIRCARSPEERAAAGTLESRTREALASAQAGDAARAEAILQAITQAYPHEAEAHFNYGLFCLEGSRYEEAIRNFTAAIAASRKYMPAFEAMAETYLRKGDLRDAAAWSRRILEIDPGHMIARQTLARIEK